jgi:hypothetical protein
MSTYILKHRKRKTNSSQKSELEWELESGSMLSLEANHKVDSPEEGEMVRMVKRHSEQQ